MEHQKGPSALPLGLKTELRDIARACGATVMPYVGNIIEAVTRIQDELAVFRAGIDSKSENNKQLMAQIVQLHAEIQALRLNVCAAAGIVNTTPLEILPVDKRDGWLLPQLAELRINDWEVDDAKAKSRDDLARISDAIGWRGDVPLSAETIIETVEHWRSLIEDGDHDDPSADLSRDMALVFESLATALAFSHNELTLNENACNAWIWAIICGADDETLSGWMKEHEWTPGVVARLNELRGMVEAVRG